MIDFATLAGSLHVDPSASASGCSRRLDATASELADLGVGWGLTLPAQWLAQK